MKSPSRRDVLARAQGGRCRLAGSSSSAAGAPVIRGHEDDGEGGAVAFLLELGEDRAALVRSFGKDDDLEPDTGFEEAGDRMLGALVATMDQAYLGGRHLDRRRRGGLGLGQAADARPCPALQRHQIESALGRRARLRPAERSRGPVHPHRGHRAGPREDPSCPENALRRKKEGTAAARSTRSRDSSSRLSDSRSRGLSSPPQ
jgi:hypothetical protein